MNKGIKLANSKFILFLNSGDEIYKKNLNFVINQSRNYNYNLICNFNILKNKKNFNYILRKLVYFIQISLNLSLPSSHNAIIYLTENLKDLPFNEKYKFGADYNQYLDLLFKKYKFKNLKRIKITQLRDDGYIFKE